MTSHKPDSRLHGRGIPDRVRAQCHLIAEQARVVTGAPRAILLLYDEASQQLVTVATPGAEVPLQRVALELIRRNYPGLDPLDLTYYPTVNRCVAGAFVGQRTQVSRMADAFEHIFPPPVAAIAHGLLGVTHVVSCPVVAEGRALGLIRFLVNKHPSDGQQALMEAAASQIGLTLLNAELAEQTRRQLEATRAIGEVARLGANSKVESVLGAVVERVRALTDADAAFVYLVDPGGTTFSIAAESLSDAARADEIGTFVAATRQVGSGLAGWVIASGEAAFVPDVRLDPRTQPRLVPVPEAVVAVPMRVGSETIGCLRLSVTGGRRFAEADLWLAQTMANEAGSVVRQARELEDARAHARAIGEKKGVEAALRLVEAHLDVLARPDPQERDLERLREHLGKNEQAASRLRDDLRSLQTRGGAAAQHNASDA